MISETAHSSQTKLIGYNLHGREQGKGNSNLTPNPKGAQGGPEEQNSSLIKNFTKKSR